jgi:alkanesulfonate monooxygenase SsuD/methylene tetrahydromethanopterin reductase-like flavin-dependent oxidoreductase (luciferase family)
MAPTLGMCFDPGYPAAAVTDYAERLEAAEIDQLWIIEDCFQTAGVTLAAAALARTSRLEVGFGILPAVSRNVAVTAMELATLAELAPGRVLAGIGHGIQEWMDQMGARTPSPLTTLEEVVTATKRLLAGERLTFDGEHVSLRDVALDPPPATAPPVLAGVQRPRSLELAGRVADGLVLVGGSGPAHVRSCIERAGRTGDATFRVVAFASICVLPDRELAHHTMAPFVGEMVEQRAPCIVEHPHGDEIVERFERGGAEAVAEIPDDWWAEIGPIGTLDDAVSFTEAVAAAGATEVAYFPGPELEYAYDDIGVVEQIAAAIS